MALNSTGPIGASRATPNFGTDIVQWLALDVADLAFKDTGFSRESVPRDRTEVIVGNTLTGEQSRANSMRLRWPFVRRALLAAADARGLPAGVQRELATVMETIYKDETLTKDLARH